MNYGICIGGPFAGSWEGSDFPTLRMYTPEKIDFRFPVTSPDTVSFSKAAEYNWSPIHLRDPKRGLARVGPSGFWLHRDLELDVALEMVLRAYKEKTDRDDRNNYEVPPAKAVDEAKEAVARLVLGNFVAGVPEKEIRYLIDQRREKYADIVNTVLNIASKYFKWDDK